MEISLVIIIGVISFKVKVITVVWVEVFSQSLPILLCIYLILRPSLVLQLVFGSKGAIINYGPSIDGRVLWQSGTLYIISKKKSFKPMHEK